jgi:hypothetical protein
MSVGTSESETNALLTTPCPQSLTLELRIHTERPKRNLRGSDIALNNGQQRLPTLGHSRKGSATRGNDISEDKRCGRTIISRCRSSTSAIHHKTLTTQELSIGTTTGRLEGVKRCIGRMTHLGSRAV